MNKLVRWISLWCAPPSPPISSLGEPHNTSATAVAASASERCLSHSLQYFQFKRSFLTLLQSFPNFHLHLEVGIGTAKPQNRTKPIRKKSKKIVFTKKVKNRDKSKPNRFRPVSVSVFHPKKSVQYN